MTERFVVHDFLIGNPILIDRAAMTMTLYSSNSHGQIYNLRTARMIQVDQRTIGGLIRRSRQSGYGYEKAKAIDRYLYAYLMTPEQREQCGRNIPIRHNDTLIAATDEYSQAIGTMCEWAYEQRDFIGTEEKAAQYQRLTQYYRDYLRDHPEPQPPK